MAVPLAIEPRRPFTNGNPYQPPFQDPSAMGTISPEGEPPKARISDPGQAESIVGFLAQANIARANREAQLKGMFDGNAPYNQWKRKRRGEAWMANFNTLEAKGRKAAAKTPYYDLFTGAPTFVSLELDAPKQEDRAKFSRIAMEELDFTLKETPDFDDAVDLMIDDYIAYGRGFLMWPDTYSWLFQQIGQHRFLVQDGTGIDWNQKLELIVVRQKFTAAELWSKIRDTERAKSLGWDIDAVIDAIRNAMPDDKQDPYLDPNLVQERLKSMDIYVTSRTSTIDTAHLYVKEFNGKVSHLIVLEYGMTTRKPTTPDFLFSKIDRFDNFRQVVAPFFFDKEDGSFHGCSAYGKDLFSICQTKDRYTMQILNSGWMRSMLLLQAKTPSAMQKAALQMISNAIVIPPDVAVQNSQVLGDITTGIEINTYLENTLDQNTGIYRPRIEKPEGNPEPMGTTQMRFAQSNSLTSSQVNRFLKQLDPAYAEMFRRMVAPQTGNDEIAEKARDFQKRCTDRGLPLEILRKKPRYVRASRVEGNGSVAMRLMAFGQTKEIVPMLPESGRSNWVDDLIAVSHGFSKVERYNPTSERQQMPEDQNRLAMLENHALKDGTPMPISVTDNHLIHTQSHLQFMSQAAGSLSQGSDPKEVYNTVETGGQHTMMHLKELAKDPTRKGALKVLMKQLHKLGQFADKLGQRLRQQAESRQQAQAVQSGQDPEIQLQAAVAGKKMQLQEAKTKHQMGLRQQQADQKSQIAATMAGQKLAIADATAAADIQRKRFSAFDPQQP